MQCVLMNKNIEIATFDASGEQFTRLSNVNYFVRNIEVFHPELLPYGVKVPGSYAIAWWLNNRSGANHNYTMDAVMRNKNIVDLEDFIHHTHAASVNDTFWVKGTEEEITWEDVSLYRKKTYNDNVAKMGLEIVSFKETKTEEHYDNCPEFTINGSFRRGFEKREDGIYLHKRSSYNGHESHSEVLAYEVAKVFLPEHLQVEYALSDRFGIQTSVCKFFTDEKTGLVTYYNITDAVLNEEEILRYMQKNGFEDEFRRMVLLDCLIFNTDRHLNNFGFLMDNDTLEVKGFAPVYDMNLSLFPRMDKEAMSHFHSYVRGFIPRFGRDFTVLGQHMLTKELQPEVKEIEDFTFSFAGDDTVSEEMVKFLEHVIQKQAHAILDEKKMFLPQVFTEEDDLSLDLQTVLQNQYETAANYAPIFKKLFLMQLTEMPYGDYELEIVENVENMDLKITIEDPQHNGLCVFDLMAKSLSFSGKQFPEEIVNLIHERAQFWNKRA